MLDSLKSLWEFLINITTILLLPIIVIGIIAYMAITAPTPQTVRAGSTYVGQNMEFSGVVTSCTRRTDGRWEVCIATETEDVIAICRDRYSMRENLTVKGKCFEYVSRERPEFFLEDCVVTIKSP